MRIVEITAKKRDGAALTDEEIAFVVEGYTAGRLPDYQVSALLMAIMFRGMDDREMGSLTAHMLHSGKILDLASLGRPVADKHSTGGVGDKTSLLIAPMAAAAGLAVPMISGRGLGHTGGTLDKLESIPGFRTDLSLDRFRELLEEYGFGLIGQTGEIAPADRKLYALRDATATVPSRPLIVASIMSKKLAEGLNALALDVKVGSGAFMKTVEDARALARALCTVGEQRGVRTQALLTRMDQPLGRAVGNALEVVECVEALKGQGPDDVVDLSVELTALMIALGGIEPDIDAARRLARRQLESGAAFERFRHIVEAQGGDPRVLDDPSLLPRAEVEAVARAPRGGFIAAVDTEAIGWAVMETGAGREAAGEPIDPGAGLLVDTRIGDEVREGDALGLVLARDASTAEHAARRIEAAFSIADEPPVRRPIVIEAVGADARG